MEKNLKNIQWGEFEIGKEFFVKNSKAYHKTKLKEVKADGISYVSRTNFNNGVESIVNKSNFTPNKKNTIVFGAENATFFYQPNEYITGNKMYYIEQTNLNKYTSLFIQMILNNSISNCGFGYGKGLIGSRVQKRFITLPINPKGEPDYLFMEQFMQQKEKEKLTKFQNYITKRLIEIKDFKEVMPLIDKQWGEFKITEIFDFDKGDQNNMSNVKKGNLPLVSAKKGDNGYKEFARQENKKLFLKNSLTLNNDGDGGAGISFYQPFDYLLDSHVTSLFSKVELNKFVLLYLSRCITNQRNKFGHGYSINNQRLKVFKFMLPLTTNGVPDYDYMENYIKKIEFEKLAKYIKVKNII